MGRAPKEINPNFDKQILSKICRQCGWGNYRLHPEQPHKYLKCCLCGHTKEILVDRKPDEEKD